MHAAYWHRDGLDIYRLADNTVQKVASGAVGTLKPLKVFGKKVLLAGRELTLHSRKRYPPISEKDLKKAISSELEELFPLSSPAFCFRVFERTKLYILVDIWAWDSSAADSIKKVFNYTHIIPEDLALVSEQSEVLLYGFKGISCLTAYSNNRFLGSSSFAGPVKAADFELFIKSLGSSASELKTLRVYGQGEPGFKSSELPNSEVILGVIKESAGDYPACLEKAGKLALREFKAGQSLLQYEAGIELALRLVAYSLLGYVLFLALSVRNYSRALETLERDLKVLSEKSEAATLQAGRAGDRSALLAELKKRLNEAASPLEVMNLLAANLPEKDFLTRLTLNERKLQLYMNSKDPLTLVKTLSGLKGVRSVKARGTLAKDKQAGNYNTFVLEVEL